jgi:hypothetical protein
MSKKDEERESLEADFDTSSASISYGLEDHKPEASSNVIYVADHKVSLNSHKISSSKDKKKGK